MKIMKVNCEKEALEHMAKEILVACRTAPKGKGQDDIVTYLTDESDREKIAKEMENLSGVKGAFFNRDAKNIRDSDQMILIGLKDAKVAGLNCGGCGYEKCADMEKQKKANEVFKGPFCSIKIMDLGIALGVAAAKAKDMGIDTRIMYSAGAAACDKKLIDAEIAIAIPMSVTGKNVFFDRKFDGK